MSNNIEAISSAEKPKTKKGRTPSKKKSSRDSGRMTDQRSSLSERTTNENKEALYEKLFFGYRNVNEALKNLQIEQQKRTIILPISTRSIGFIIRSLVAKFSQQNIMTHEELYILVNALYRIGLCQIDYKIEEAMVLQHSRNLERQSFEETYVSGDIRRALDVMGAGFSPINNYISAIGYVRTTGKVYLPRHPKTHVASPYHVRIDRLRALVVSLSNNELPDDVVRFFYDHNPLPGAMWRLQAAQNAEGAAQPTITLVNPDAIISQMYGLTAVRDDIMVISAAIEKIGKKYPKYVSTGGIDWKGLGSISQIVSTSDGNISCPSWLPVGKVHPVVGEHSNFWTADVLSDPEAYMGVVYLMGENSDLCEVGECQSYRSRFAASSEINLDYASVMQNLIN